MLVVDYQTGEITQQCLTASLVDLRPPHSWRQSCTGQLERLETIAVTVVA